MCAVSGVQPGERGHPHSEPDLHDGVDLPLERLSHVPLPQNIRVPFGLLGRHRWSQGQSLQHTHLPGGQIVAQRELVTVMTGLLLWGQVGREEATASDTN